MEIEAKYTVPDRPTFERLLALTALGGYALRSAPAVSVVAPVTATEPVPLSVIPPAVTLLVFKFIKLRVEYSRGCPEIFSTTLPVITIFFELGFC